MEKRGQKPIFFSDRSKWIPFDPPKYENDFPITERNIYDALTDPEMLSDRVDRILSYADARKIDEVRRKIGESYEK